MFPIYAGKMPDKAGAKVAKDAGNVEFKAGRYENAIKCYDSAIELDPEEAMYPANRAMVYLKMKKWAEAESDCSTAIGLDPKSAKVKGNVVQRSSQKFSLFFVGI